MSENTQDQLTQSPQTLEPAATDQTWLVQCGQVYDPDPGEPEAFVGWVDVGTVTVPARTRRKTIISKALEEHPDMAPVRPPAGGEGIPVSFRVLDPDSAEEIPVRWEVPPAPEAVLVVG